MYGEPFERLFHTSDLYVLYQVSFRPRSSATDAYLTQVRCSQIQSVCDGYSLHCKTVDNSLYSEAVLIRKMFCFDSRILKTRYLLGLNSGTK